jgi:hypothetical protein
MHCGLRFLGLLVCCSSWANAGTLANGMWTPVGCGVKPDAPVIDERNAEVFNKSVAAINDWQSKNKAYFECLIKEANTDNAIIAESANKAQAANRETIEHISATANAAKKKLDAK